MIVGAVSCSFKREIKPYRKFETWTRVVSWDDKWIYMVTHFVEKGHIEQGQCILKSDSGSPGGQHKGISREPHKRTLYASAITQFVCKRDRITVPPSAAMEECGLLSTLSGTSDFEPNDHVIHYKRDADTPASNGLEPPFCDSLHMTLEEIETFRRDNLPIVQLKQGWDRVHELFREEDPVLAGHGVV
ncbi:hypothetical protein Plec18167_003765 [Paecilomyces lecythidis]|uniref:Uncharacterized protein n=1 Tax=Paecilomyces lecythidis TaxID=3004212 RepID=A0ABR3XXJ6_9EURO